MAAGDTRLKSRPQLSASPWLMSAVIMYRGGNVISGTYKIMISNSSCLIFFPDYVFKYIHSMWSHLTPEQTFPLSAGTPC